MGFSQTYFAYSSDTMVSVCGIRRNDLSKYTGKINIAFKYVGSGKSLGWCFSGR
jgi:hypothetical protein